MRPKTAIIILFSIAIAGIVFILVLFDIAKPEFIPETKKIMHEDNADDSASQEEKEEWALDTLRTMRENSADDSASQEEKEEWVVDALEKMHEDSVEEKK